MSRTTTKLWVEVDAEEEGLEEEVEEVVEEEEVVVVVAPEWVEEFREARASWSMTQCRSLSARSRSRFARAALALSTWRCMNFIVFKVPLKIGLEGSLSEVFCSGARPP